MNRKGLLNEAVVRLGEIRPDRDIYQYAVLSIIAKRRDSLKVLQSLGLIKTVVDAAWFIVHNTTQHNTIPQAFFFFLHTNIYTLHISLFSPSPTHTHT